MQHWDQATDEELIVLLAQEDKQAFGEIYRRYKAALILHAFKKLGDFEQAKDVVQEVFSTLWHNRISLSAVNSLPAYLYVLVQRRVLNVVKHHAVANRYLASFNEYLAENPHTPDQVFREKELAALIDKEIASLPDRMREVLILSRKEHLKHREIAERLGISEFTVKNHMKAALKVLRRNLGNALFLFC
ncbi:RNA polymerase sigma factor [Pedobacter faecalis]|uniref:RNA polymerase sigma factor n=1 Tax=Pedobacter faecalis TaxID=3041495 RepID=UPI00254F0990|nr:RNA polymerase sigma-70 factor [Pedobacter sp. ELA7]